ncbi:MAG: hypothetical protein Ta2E_09920 [Mycoplasmoidaceae bacterium]|nr:MAG: hypothetical protein Ta2E_09920 [Mycoplasmoidaceae bacterium]
MFVQQSYWWKIVVAKHEHKLQDIKVKFKQTDTVIVSDNPEIEKFLSAKLLESLEEDIEPRRCDWKSYNAIETGIKRCNGSDSNVNVIPIKNSENLKMN